MTDDQQYAARDLLKKLKEAKKIYAGMRRIMGSILPIDVLMLWQ